MLAGYLGHFWVTDRWTNAKHIQHSSPNICATTIIQATRPCFCIVTNLSSMTPRLHATTGGHFLKLSCAHFFIDIVMSGVAWLLPSIYTINLSYSKSNTYFIWIWSVRLAGKGRPASTECLSTTQCAGFKSCPTHAITIHVDSWKTACLFTWYPVGIW